LTNSFLIGKRYNEEKHLTKGRPKIGSSFPINDDLLTSSTSDKIGAQSNVSDRTVKSNEKFALALESIETKTNIPKYEFLIGKRYNEEKHLKNGEGFYLEILPEN
jgi:hypothetical protein